MKSLSRVRLSATPWPVAHQVPPPMGFSRHKYWSGLSFPSPGDIPDPGVEPGLPPCGQTLCPLSQQGSPRRDVLLQKGGPPTVPGRRLQGQRPPAGGDIHTFQSAVRGAPRGWGRALLGAGCGLGSAFVLESSSHCGEDCLGTFTGQSAAFPLVAGKPRPRAGLTPEASESAW